MNRVTLIGNLGSDPEVKELADGLKVAKLKLATTEVYRGKDKELHTNTDWHTVIFWRSLAGLAEKYLKKGSLILVEGRLKYRRYEDNAGVKRYLSEVVADNMILLDKKVPSKNSADDESLWNGIAPF